MPNNGRIIDWAALELRCASDASVSSSGVGSATYGHQASAATNWIVNAIDVEDGIQLTSSSSFNGTTGSWQVTYNGPGAPFGGYIVGGAGYLPSVEIVARLVGVKLYAKLTGSLWRMVWSAVEIYINGALDIVLPGSAVDITSDGVGPNYIPLIGMPVRLTGGVSAGRTGVPAWTYDPCNPAAGAPIAWLTETTGGAEGGWRFQEYSGSWVALPATPFTLEPPAGSGCPFGLSLGGIVDVETTWDARINCRSKSQYLFQYVERAGCSEEVLVICVAEEGGDPGFEYTVTGPSECVDPCTGLIGPSYQDVYSTETWSESQGGAVRLVPNLERAIRRLGDSYRALWYRGTFPETKALASRSCTDDAVTVNTSSNPIVHPATSEFLGCVGSATHPIEDPLGLDAYCPTSASKSQSYNKTFALYGPIACQCPPSWVEAPDCPSGIVGYSCATICPVYDPISQSESVSLAYPSSVGAGGGYQSHANPEARYLATWPNPHWQFFFWRDDWDVDGGPVAWTDYWGPIREQWLYDAALPAPEQRRTRNSLILSPVETEQGNTPFLDTFAGGLRWLGVSRWITQEVAIPAECQLSLDRPGEWQVEEDAGIPQCAIAFGVGGLTLSGFTGADATIELQLGSWSTAPFMQLHLARKVQLAWSLTNVASIEAYLVGIDGEATLLGEDPGLYAFPQGEQSKYAGSWAIDNGAGAVPDTGSDLLPEGISAATMADPERAFAFQLASGRGYATLRLVVTPVDPGDPVEIDWPRFELASEHPRAFWESGKCCSLIWPNGPGVRWGQWTFYDPILGFQDPPLVTALGVTSTIIDWLCFRRRVIEGGPIGAGLAGDVTTELGLLYDSYEGQSIGVVDKFGMGVPLPKASGNTVRAALINSFSELPPVACFPFRGRNMGSWQPTEDHAQVVYDMAEETRPLVSPVPAAAHLADDLGADVGTAMAMPPAGWFVWQYAPALDNDETDWKIRVGTLDIAEVRPFHGFFTAYKTVAEGVDGGIWIDQTADARFMQASIEGDDVWFRRIDTSAPVSAWTTEIQASAYGDCRNVCFCVDQRTQRIHLVFEREVSAGAFEVWRCWSDDDGATFGGFSKMADGRNPKIARGEGGALLVLWFVHDAGDSGPGKLQFQYQGPGDSALSAAADVEDDTGAIPVRDEASFSNPEQMVDAQGRWMLSLVKDGESAISHWMSFDEPNFSFTRL